MNSFEFTYKLDNIDAIAQQFLEQLPSKNLLFYGDMGSGKTTFINALLKALGSHDKATSPTFSLVNEYSLPKNEKMYHFDLYRIEKNEELFDLGIEDYLYSDAWLCIEWPERLLDIAPDNSQSLIITVNDDNSRSLKLYQNTKQLTENSAVKDTKF